MIRTLTLILAAQLALTANNEGTSPLTANNEGQSPIAYAWVDDIERSYAVVQTEIGPVVLDMDTDEDGAWIASVGATPDTIPTMTTIGTLAEGLALAPDEEALRTSLLVASDLAEQILYAGPGADIFGGGDVQTIGPWGECHCRVTVFEWRETKTEQCPDANGSPSGVLSTCSRTTTAHVTKCVPADCNGAPREVRTSTEWICSGCIADDS